MSKTTDLPPRQCLAHNESLAVEYSGTLARTSASDVMLSYFTKVRRACAGVRFPNDEWGRTRL